MIVGWRLQDLAGILQREARDAGGRARGAWVDVLTKVRPFSADSRRRRLVRGLPVRRLDDLRSPDVPPLGGILDEGMVFGDALDRERLRQPAAPVSLEVGLAARGPGRIERLRLLERAGMPPEVFGRASGDDRRPFRR